MSQGPVKPTPGELAESDYIYDWNATEKVAPLARQRFTLNDETLRDGIQSPSVTDPKIEDKLAILRLLDAVGVDQVRLVQCDTAVTGDECIDPTQLESYPVSGYGGSDLTPAMEHLAADPATRAVIVITDGEIDFPRDAPPYNVLWVLPERSGGAFNPSYGRVVRMAST